jgi:signal transduction histidine kinase
MGTSRVNRIGVRVGRAIGGVLRPLMWGVLVGGPQLALMPAGQTVRTVATIVLALAATDTPLGGGRFLDRTHIDKFFRLGFVTGLSVFALLGGIAPNAFLVGCVFFVASKTLQARLTNVVAVAVAVLAMAFGGLLVSPHVSLVTGEAWTGGGALRDVLRFGMLALLVLGVRTDERKVADAERAAEVAVAEERARIARELHDVVAHHVSVMTIQTEAARTGSTAGSRVDAALGAAAESGRTAMTELRRLLGVLRSSGEEAETAPQPGLDDVARLVDDVRSTGTSVDLVVDGTPPAGATDGFALSVYRIVQEALTNALRHAPGASIEVRLAYGPSAVRIEVEDRGPGKATSATPGGGGHGLVGMRERVRLLDGTLTAGPVPGGAGWLVRADLPVDAEVPA